MNEEKFKKNVEEAMEGTIRHIVGHEVESYRETFRVCKKCKCLMRKDDAIEVENLERIYVEPKQRGVFRDSLPACEGGIEYYCGRCKPEYDKIDENGKKLKLKEIK